MENFGYGLKLQRAFDVKLLQLAFNATPPLRSQHQLKMIDVEHEDTSRLINRTFGLLKVN